MQVNSNLTYNAQLKVKGFDIEAAFDDRYVNGVNLIRGLIGGGYIGASIWSTVTTLNYGTDSWGTSAATIHRVTKYGGWASAHTNGYFFLNAQDNYNGNDKIQFATESVTRIADRTYTGDAPSSMQHGIGYDANGAPYGFKAYTCGTASTGYDKLTFNTDTWMAASDGNIMSSSHWVAWFDRENGYAFAGNTTFRYPFATETWSSGISTVNSPGGLGHNGDYLAKGLNSKIGKFYLTTGYVKIYTLFQYQNTISTWSINRTGQTLYNCETAGTLGQSWGYFAGGYNDVTGQNAHTDKMFYNTDTVVNIADAPRSLSSASPTWSPI